jgi:putative endonuclease
MNYSVYVLVSLKNSSLYIGMTSRDPRERLKEHNQGESKYTNLHRPYKLVYYEMNFCKECALNREQFLKSGQGRKILKILVDN